ncbi:MAG: serine/threonine protein kinase [Anaerolineae bacterium]|nr:serine/threonine protein kinase [Anaerolineae bacterium]
MASANTRDVGGKQYHVRLMSEHLDPDRVFASRLYEGWDPLLQRQVALKEMVALQQNKQGEEFLKHARDEARLLAQLGEHSNLPLIYNVAEEKDCVWLEMEFVKGKTLFDLYLGSNAQPPDWGGILAILEIALDVCRALLTLHRHHIAHRDVTPANIIVGPQGGKLVDVGLAVWPSRRAYEAWEEGEGTRGYRAPEQTAWRGPLTIPSPASDVYGLGAVLYHLLTASPLPPLPPGTDPPPPSHANDAVPPALDDLITAALVNNPKERPKPGEFYERLRAIRDSLRHNPATSEVTKSQHGETPLTQDAIPSPAEKKTELKAEQGSLSPPNTQSSNLAERYNERVQKPTELPKTPPPPRKLEVTMPTSTEQVRAKRTLFAISGGCLIACLGVSIGYIVLLKLIAIIPQLWAG